MIIQKHDILPSKKKKKVGQAVGPIGKRTMLQKFFSMYMPENLDHMKKGSKVQFHIAWFELLIKMEVLIVRIILSLRRDEKSKETLRL